MTSKYDLPGVYDAHKREMRERMERERAVIFRPMRLPPGTFMVTFFYQQRECEVCGKIEQEELSFPGAT